MVITQESLRRELYMQQGASPHTKKAGVRNIEDIRPIGLCGYKYIEKIQSNIYGEFPLLPIFGLFGTRETCNNLNKHFFC